MLFTASFYQPHNWVGRCFRISRQHPRGRKVLWGTLPFLYPGLQLIKSYRSGKLGFDSFSRSYRSDLDDSYAHAGELQQWVQELPHQGDFTLLCFEPEGEPCHRLVLAGWLKERRPSLELGDLR